VGLVTAVERTLRRHAMLAGGETVLVAVSGGADSVALLWILTTLAPAWRVDLHVLHVDHGLRAGSARDGDFVRALAARLGVPADVERVQVGPGSVEAAARAARYAALQAWADRLGASRIAVGHTADDQAETVLMRVLGGAGVRGLAAIPPVRGRVVRPLIEVRRQTVVAGLRAAGLDWIEDPTNRDPKFLRNRIRHEVLPLLAAAHRADVVPALARVARLARETLDALERTATLTLEGLVRVEAGGLTLSRTALAALPAPVAVEVLHQAVVRAGSRSPLRAWAHRGLQRVLATVPPRRPFRLGGVAVEVSADRVRVGAHPAPVLLTRALPVPGRVELPEIGRALEARRLPADGYTIPRTRDRVAFDAAGVASTLTVRHRRPGDRFQAYGAGERRLKSLLIDAKLPRWERARLPLVEQDGRILWVAGVRRSAAASVTGATREVVELHLMPLAEPEGGR
jgi:tRNA(Ile)-lysidine synthase